MSTALRVPVPVPGRRREHGQRMGDVEPQRRLRDELRGGVSGGADRAGLHLLPVVPVRTPVCRWVSPGACTPT